MKRAYRATSIAIGTIIVGILSPLGSIGLETKQAGS